MPKLIDWIRRELFDYLPLGGSLLYNKMCKHKVKLATLVEGDPKVPFSIATTPRWREGAIPFPGLLHFTLDP